jgi:hypothetical protein
MSQKNTENRREFLATSARLLAFGGLAAYGANQVLRGRRLENDPTCIKLDTCQACVEFGGCTKDKAEHYRENFGKDV